MERRNEKGTAIVNDLNPENAEAYVDKLLDLVRPEHLIGDPDVCTDFNQTLNSFKQDITDQLSRFKAGVMIEKIDQGIATKHYAAVMEAVKADAVTDEVIESIRRVPVGLSPVQKNIDALREEALAAQHNARTNTDKALRPQLKDHAEVMAKIVTSYGADTAVVKAGLKVMNGEQYVLQKLAETDRQLPRNDDARRDIAGIVRDAYGEQYSLREVRPLVEKARVVIATVATAAALSSMPNIAAAASEKVAAEVLPGNPSTDKAIKDINKKVSMNIVNKTNATLVKNEVKQLNNTSPETATKDKVVTQQAPEKSGVVVQDNPVAEKEKASSSKLVFKIPGATKPGISEDVANDDVQSEVAVDDETKPTSPNVTPVDPNEKASADSGVAEPVAASPNEIALNENSGQVPIIEVATRLQNSPDKITSKPIGAEIEAIDDDSIIKFKIPRERNTNDIIEDQIIIKDGAPRPSFSITKKKKNPGVQPDQMPEGFKIAPIPVVPAPEAAPATPTPEQPPTPASDYTQAAQKMAERGGVWERRGIAMKFLIEDPELAYTPSQAAGIVGNLLGESGPEMHPGQSQIGGPAFGIVQWEGGRLLDLGAFAGKDQADFMTQLRFLKYEFLGKERTAFNAIKATTNRKDAAIVTRKMYERPSVHRDEERIAYANVVGDAFNKEYQAILSSRIPAAPEAQPNGILAGWPSTGEAAMELFNQCDPSWGEIKTPNGTRACDVSCGPTSVAMAVNALTDREVNPGEVIRFTNKNKMWLAGDAGTSFDGVINLGKNFGINGYQMQNFKDINAYKEVLQNGGMILVAGSGPVPFVAAPKAHFVLIRGMTTDGKFLVADPYPKTADTNTKSWDANQIINGTFGAVVFTK